MKKNEESENAKKFMEMLTLIFLAAVMLFLYFKILFY